MIVSAEQAIPAVVAKLRDDSSIDCEVLEGDHELLPSTPIICVYPGATSRRMVGSPRRVEADIGVELMVYHGALQAKELNQQEALAMIDLVVKICEKDADLNGDAYVINCLVERVQHGEATKGRSKWFASRVNLTLTSRFTLEVVYA
jgi:hypothetical protein